MTKKKRFKIIATIAFFLLFVGLVVFAFSGENFVILKELFRAGTTKEEVREALDGLGIRAYLAVGVLSMLQVVLAFVPAEPIQVMSGISFGLWKGSLVCLSGLFVGNTLVYVLYKIYGARLGEYFEKNAEFDFETASRSPKIAMIVILLYVLPAIPYGLICFFTASLNIKYPKYIILTTIGAIPSIFLDVGVGHLALAASWAFAIVVFAVLVVLLLLLYKYKKQVFAKVNEYMKKHSEPYSSKTAVRKPSKPLYNLIVFFSRFAFNTKLKIRLNNEVGKLERPAIVLCNHGSFIDFVYAGQLLKKEKPNFVTARLYFFHKTLGKLLKKAGSFPKSMFTADIENAKNCVRVLSAGGVITMMPEARLSTIGKYEGVQDSTYKFLQRTNVAVYAFRMHGDYFAKPKWGDKIRKGAYVEGTLSPLFKAGEPKTLTLDEIKTRVDDALSYDEFAWLETKPQLTYSSKTLAKGLENILCVCPVCGKKYTLQTDGLKVFCSECAYAQTLNNRYGYTVAEPFKNFAEHYEWQVAEFAKEIDANPEFRLESGVTLFHACKGGKKMLETAGEGVCRLDRTGLTYTGTRYGAQIEKHFPLADIYRILFGAGEDFEVYEGQEIWYFVPEEKRSCVAWYIVSGLLKE